MGIVGVLGDRRRVNHELIAYALTHVPALVVDCANACDTHHWFTLFPDADFTQVYVYEMELLYKFRDSLLHVAREAELRGANTVVVTSTDHLFHYQNENENREIYAQVWELLVSLGKHFEVRVAVSPKMVRWAERFGVPVVPVGHVVSSQRQNLEQMIAELERYARALRPEERALFTDVLRVPLRHVGPLSSANSLHAWSFMLLSIMVEHERRLRTLEHYAGLPHRRIPDEEQHRLVAQG